MEFLLDEFWFCSNEWILRPEKIYQWIDGYRNKNSWWWRYIMRFYNRWNKQLSLSEKLSQWKRDILKSYESKPSHPLWEFGEDVAHIFQDHAFKHIQDYNIVIELCIRIIKKYKPLNSKLLEFWSALWYTLNILIKEWYLHSRWIEKSEAMIQQSLHKEYVRLWDKILPEDWPFDVILSNWTLHFIEERRKHLELFYEHMEVWWFLFITDKIKSSNIANELYLDFKRNAWVSEQEIKEKTESLRWVLYPFDTSWYFTNIREIWFSSIDIIHATPAFVTFLIIK
jgi:tRNA (cmo5U34)-methyltransferase